MVSDQSVPGATRKPDKIPADYDPVATGATSEVNMAHNNGARSPSQASPNDGRIFPAKAKGSRPTYFDDDGASDAMVQIVTALAAEVWALTERIHNLEQILVDQGHLKDDLIENYELASSEEEQRLEDASLFAGRIFRVLEEMREEIVTEESPDDYLAVVDRAFSELGRKSRRSNYTPCFQEKTWEKIREDASFKHSNPISPPESRPGFENYTNTQLKPIGKETMGNLPEIGMKFDNP